MERRDLGGRRNEYLDGGYRFGAVRTRRDRKLVLSPDRRRRVGGLMAVQEETAFYRVRPNDVRVLSDHRERDRLARFDGCGRRIDCEEHRTIGRVAAAGGAEEREKRRADQPELAMTP